MQELLPAGPGELRGLQSPGGCRDEQETSSLGHSQTPLKGTVGQCCARQRAPILCTSRQGPGWLPFTKVLRDVTKHPCTVPAPGAGHTWVRGATSSVLEVVALPAPCRPQDREVLGSGHPQNRVCPRFWGSTAQQCRRGSSVGSGAFLLSVQVRAREPRNFLTKQTTLVPDGICAHARYKLSPQLPC